MSVIEQPTYVPRDGTPFEQILRRPKPEPIKVVVKVAAPRRKPLVEKPVAPGRTVEQRLSALEKANATRSRRAQLKRDLKAGEVLVVDLIASPPEFIETMKTFDLLLAVPKYGRVKVNKILSRERISPSKTIGGLSERQRRELVRALRG